ncbi:KAZN [Cordylochernes scorpioides]|uniref:KAZN n=1 Tax=Cordylochernes scorpioides TaxID=51811 RepID=A0ABY6KJ65_9ARAC|nr:KAZN [Cordylochernes scorpioides]
MWAAEKKDRKKLQGEKFDLLNQMKQLYETLEDKERELRDFIRTYEQRMRESDDSIRQLVREREETEREKWNILQHARDEAERAVALCAQLGLKETQIRQLQDELSSRSGEYLSDAESRIGLYRTNGFHSPAHNAPTPTPGSSDPPSSCVGTPTLAAVEGNSSRLGLSPPVSPLPAGGLSRSAEEIYNSSGGSDCSGTQGKKAGGKKGTWGTISRVFSRGRHRKVPSLASEASMTDGESGSPPPGGSQQLDYLSKLRLVEEAQGLPMDRWRAATVLAWLEISLGMPQYGARCAQNIKSGKVLLELSDSELESGLGISNPLHRRKLRLAIEDHREPSLCLYPKLGLLGHGWVVEEWLPSLGLGCYAERFAAQLVDGRVLETLTRRDLEKHLGVTRRFHQASLAAGIHLLRTLRYDRHLLAQRRALAEHSDVDPMVWTNQRLIQWAHSIDLGEYASNLRDSGVHGALMVLEPTFTSETLAAALGIPPSKTILRRHLATEVDALIQPARHRMSRLSLETEEGGHRKQQVERRSLTSAVSTNSLGRTFIRSYPRSHTLDQPDKKRTSLRGSLSRALGLKVRQKLKRSPSFQGTFPVVSSSHDKKYPSLTVTPV